MRHPVIVNLVTRADRQKDRRHDTGIGHRAHWNHSRLARGPQRSGDRADLVRIVGDDHSVDAIRVLGLKLPLEAVHCGATLASGGPVNYPSIRATSF